MCFMLVYVIKVYYNDKCKKNLFIAAYLHFENLEITNLGLVLKIVIHKINNNKNTVLVYYNFLPSSKYVAMEG